jgi:iron complex transport system substrate-binding protein
MSDPRARIAIRERRFFPLAAMLAALLVLCGVTAAAAPFTDDRGHAVAIEVPATRIVTLAPNLTELAFAAGAGSRIIGVSAYSDYPEAARRLTRVGDASNLDFERMLMLKPDLVLAWKSGNRGADIELMERLGLPVFAIELDRLGDVPRALRTIGTLAGTEPEAERSASAFEAEVAALRARYGGRPPVTVFYQIWHQPLMTISGAHMIADVIRLCGGRNVFEGLSALTPAVSMESVLAADPQAIVLSASSREEDARASALLNQLPELQAVAHGQIFSIHPDLIQRQTPRILAGARRLCEALESTRPRTANRQ